VGYAPDKARSLEGGGRSVSAAGAKGGSALSRGCHLSRATGADVRDACGLENEDLDGKVEGAPACPEAAGHDRPLRVQERS
jgi:hypothetical protein